MRVYYIRKRERERERKSESEKRGGAREILRGAQRREM